MTDSRKRTQRLAEQGRALLVARFPNCFMPKGAEKKPLKIGIYFDIKKAGGVPARLLGPALNDYTRGPTYGGNVVPDAMRVDLDGNPAGEVTHREAASYVRFHPKRQPEDA